MKKNGMPSTGPLTKVKILGDNVKLFKEKKSSRETFACGACGQLGYMRTNKNYPKYGEDPEMQFESHKLTMVIRHQVDANKGQAESLKKSIVIRPPTNMERDQVEPHKPSVVICPPADKDRKQHHKKIIIKRTTCQPFEPHQHGNLNLFQFFSR